MTTEHSTKLPLGNNKPAFGQMAYEWLATFEKFLPKLRWVQSNVARHLVLSWSNQKG